MENDRRKKKKAHKKSKGTLEAPSEDSSAKASEVSKGRNADIDSSEPTDRRLHAVTFDKHNQDISEEDKEDNTETSEEDNQETSEEDSAGEDSDIQSNENDEKTSTEQEYVKLRQELAELPFEDIQKLKERIGLKQFNEIYYGTSEKPNVKKTSSGKRTFKRENKNRPMEMSSKRPVPRLKSAVPAKKAVVRDPRFDDLSGEYNETIFQQTYGFLTGVKQREKEKLLVQLKKEKDPDKKRKISSLVTRLTQKEHIEIEKQAKKEREKKLRTEEKEMVKDGKKPFYWKKSEKRKLELAEKFRELKKSGKVEGYLGKKRKRTAARERKKLPNKG